MTIHPPVSKIQRVHLSSTADCMKTDVNDSTRNPRPPEINRHSHSGCLFQIHPVKIDARLIYLNEDTRTIGRDEVSGLPLPDPSVSRQHAGVFQRGEDSFIEDFGSTNGTWVNDIRVPQGTPYRLMFGDRLRCGSHVFKFLSAGDIETQYHEAAYAMITRDGSTDAMNKPSLLENFDREIGRALRRERELSLILFDVDFFKRINDEYGHLAGDQVLKGICNVVRQTLRNEEFIARFGGEEFAILLPEEDLSAATSMAERCRDAIQCSNFETCSGIVNVTISLGICELAEISVDGRMVDSEDAPCEHLRRSLRQDMINLADARLYAAKTAGRNQLVCH